MDEVNFEKFPGEGLPDGRVENGGGRQVPNEEDFEKSFEKGVPPFAGGKQGELVYSELYGESSGDNIVTSEDHEYEEGVSEAEEIINYGLNAAARDHGVGYVVDKIKTFDATGSVNPIKDLFEHLEIDTREEVQEVKEEARAAAPTEEAFRVDENVRNKGYNSKEGALMAISKMKELIAEVEGADPRYEDLRQRAKSFGMGYFDYAVKDYGVHGLTQLFDVLAEQRKQAEEGGKTNIEAAKQVVPEERQDDMFKNNEAAGLSPVGENEMSGNDLVNEVDNTIDLMAEIAKRRGQAGEVMERKVA